jgi:hypothetical protein
VDLLMSMEGKQGLRIFLQYWLLIAVLGAFNFYRYFTTRATLSLVVGIGCAAVFVGWVLFYLLYVRNKS